LFPLRRDARGKAIRDRAVVWAVVVGGLSYALLSLGSLVFSLTWRAGWLAFLAGVIAYFIVSNWLYVHQ